MLKGLLFYLGKAMSLKNVAPHMSPFKTSPKITDFSLYNILISSSGYSILNTDSSELAGCSVDQIIISLNNTQVIICSIFLVLTVSQSTHNPGNEMNKTFPH